MGIWCCVGHISICCELRRVLPSSSGVPAWERTSLRLFVHYLRGMTATFQGVPLPADLPPELAEFFPRAVGRPTPARIAGSARGVEAAAAAQAAAEAMDPLELDVEEAWNAERTHEGDIEDAA